jgi:hypothetical protein
VTNVPVAAVAAAEMTAATVSVVSAVVARVSVVMTGRRGPLMGEIIRPAITAISAGMIHAALPGLDENLEP